MIHSETVYGPERPSSADIDLYALWSTFRLHGSRFADRSAEFVHYLLELISDPDAIDELTFCARCRAPEWEDDTCSVNTVGEVCAECADYYEMCQYCEDRYPGHYLTETLAGSAVCENCRHRYYTYCDYCDGYYSSDDEYEHQNHQHDGLSCCESPQMQFRVRNDGTEPLANDTRAAIILPAGTISAAGMRAIRDYLADAGNWDLARNLDSIGDQWQTRNGNFAKRLSRHAYQVHQAKLTPEVMSQVGCIARDHSKEVSVAVEFTRDLNQPASYFLHEDSCYWGSYSESRCALKTNGGFGLRTFNEYGSLSGRAWVIPLRQTLMGLAPTFDTLTPDAFVVFNGYGDMGGYAPARIMAHMAGWTYRKIGFSCDPIYINAGGYLVAPEDIAQHYTDGSLSLRIPQHANLYESGMSHA